GHPTRVQGRFRTRLSRRQTPRERLEHFEDRRSDRYAAQQLVQEAGAVSNLAGNRRVVELFGRSKPDDRPPSRAARATAGQASGPASPKPVGRRREESPNSEG